MVTDPVGDLIVRLKNAGMVGHTSVVVPFSRFKQAIAETLKKEGYLTSVETKGRSPKRELVMELAYDASGACKIAGAARVSRPGRRVYTPAKEIHPSRTSGRTLILSTPQGVLTDYAARKAGIGGEALFNIW